MNLLKNIYHYLSRFFCEPTTAITDLMLAGFCLWCFFQLKKIISKKDSLYHWQLFFLAVGGSTFMGGLAHSLSCDKQSIYYITAWLLMQLFSGLSLFFAQQAAFLNEITNKKTRGLLKSLSIIQLIVFAVLVIVFMDFKVVAVNSLIGLVQLAFLLFPKSLIDWEYKTLVTAGLLSSFITVYINRTKLSFSHWFNYNDISHIVIFISLLLIYRGVRHKQNQNNLFRKQHY